MDTALFTCFAVAYVTLSAVSARRGARWGWWSPANLPLPVLLGLAYDNTVIAIGRLIGVSPLLESLNLARFWIHALVTPVLVAWALHALRRAGYPWARTRAFQVASIGAAVALMVLELATEVRGLRIVPRSEHGVVSYTNAAPADGPPLMVLVVALVLIAVGATLWRRQGWPWLLAGALTMTIGSAVPWDLPSGALTNAFELVLLASVVATTLRQDRTGAPCPPGAVSPGSPR